MKQAAEQKKKGSPEEQAKCKHDGTYKYIYTSLSFATMILISFH